MTTAAVSTASSAGRLWPRKSGRAGRVDEVDARVGVREVHHDGVERVLHAPLERVVVADGGAALEAAGGADARRRGAAGPRPGWSCRRPPGRPAPRVRMAAMLGEAGLGMGVLLDPGASRAAENETGEHAYADEAGEQREHAGIDWHQRPGDRATETRPRRSCAAFGCAVGRAEGDAAIRQHACRCASAGRRARGRTGWPCPAA